MSRVCQVTGRRTQKGNTVARRGLPKRTGGIGLKTTGIRRRTFKPNLQNKRVFVPELGQWVRVRVSTKALKTMDKNGPYKVLVEAGIIKPLRQRKKKADASA